MKMRIRAVLVPLLAVLGCSGQEVTDADRLAGTRWISHQQDGSACSLLLLIDDDAMAARQDLLCELSGGTLGTEVREGNIEHLGGGEATVRWTLASCPPNFPLVETLRYTILEDGDGLNVTNREGTIIYERNRGPVDTIPSATIQHGCFDSSGNFTPMSIRDL